MVVPTFLVAMIVGLVACAAQVGLYLTWEPLTPNWDRINPVNGFQRLFSGKGAMEGVKALLKLAIVTLVVWSFLNSHVNEAPLFFSKNLNESNALTLSLLSKLFFSILFSLSVLSILDYAYQRWQLEKQMKTTRREAKEEFKLREGDPLIKNRIKAIQRRIASRRMMEAVPKADVIVTNPTHIAVALKYDSDSMHAPRVLAKGAGVIAQKIKEVARFNRVPVVENKPLARTLFKQLDIGEYIPRELYKAVAEVLAYVYRLRGLQKVAHG
jgi:flagellar biosynthetic protein FlhB